MALSVSHLGLELSEGSKWGESTLGLSAAYAISNYSSIGFTGRVLKNWTDIEDASAWGISLDFGVTERISKHAWFGVAGKNVLNQIYYSKITEQLDPQWNIAFAYDKLLGLVSLECDAVIKDKELNRFLTGVEYTAANDLFFVSGGIDWRLTEGERAIPSFGFGSSYRVSEIALSFSFDPEEAFGMQTHVSLGLLF